MSKKRNSEKEIEEAQQKIRGNAKEQEKKEEKAEPKKKQEEELLEEIEGQELEELQLQKPRQDLNLEDIARKAAPLPAEVRDLPYVEQLSQRPMDELYKEIKDIYRTVEEKGYLSPADQRKVEYVTSAVERKLQDEEAGTYSFTEEAARAASITKQLGTSMMGTYKRDKHMETYRSS